jgi:hypothetical protein
MKKKLWDMQWEWCMVTNGWWMGREEPVGIGGSIKNMLDLVFVNLE